MRPALLANSLRITLTIQLWAYMLLYAPARFLRQCAKIKFLNTLEEVLNSQSTLRVVRERLLDVLAGAVAATSYQDVSGLGVLWRKVKSSGKPDKVDQYPRCANLFDY